MEIPKNRPPETKKSIAVRKTIEFRPELWKFLNDNFPSQSWWVINTLLEELKIAMDVQTPRYFMKQGAQELSEKLNVDLDNNDASKQ